MKRRTVRTAQAPPDSMSRARQAHQRGQLDEADSLYSRILLMQPDNAEALHLRGVVAYQRGEYQKAEEWIRRAIGIKGGDPDFYSNLGSICLQQWKFEEAARWYRKTIELKPDHAIAWNNLGTALNKTGRNDEAEGCLKRAIALKPDYAEAHNNLGIVLNERGNIDEAIECYRRAASIKPDYAEAYCNAGIAHTVKKNFDEAIAAYGKALAADPRYAIAHYNLGVVFGLQGLFYEAIGEYRKALEARPAYGVALQNLVHQMQHVCDWEGLWEKAQKLRELVRTSGAHDIPAFSFMCIESTAEEQLQCARMESKRILLSLAGVREQKGFSFGKETGKKLRIGYISSDFKQHATAYLVAELFERHDRREFEIYGYFCNKDDGSAMWRRLREAFDKSVDLADLPAREAASVINRDGVDILVDLKGYTLNSRPEIMALRAAPIQVSFLAYPGTMGAEFIDYLVTDRFIVPEGHEKHYSEKLVYMPWSYQVNDRKRKIGGAGTRAGWGLPEDSVVLCCFNSNYKITAEVFDIWMRLLREEEGSVLWLLESNVYAAEKLRKEAEKRGVCRDRVVFARRVGLEEHLGRHAHADLFVDTYPVNAHTTASDALWAGLPVVTRAGETFISRVGGSLLRASGLQELVTYSLAEYEEKVRELMKNREKLRELRERLAAGRESLPLFDSEGFTRQLERAYREMREQYLKGESPRHITVV
jgi:protein O-GlcNAc transferase